MKKISLNKAIIQNWRGQNIELNFMGQDCVLSGANKAGKSTVKDSIIWLLTGYDSAGRYNYNLFDNNIKYSYDNNPEASVFAEFDIDGNMYTFKRTAKKGFTRVRGANEYTSKGTDDYKFYVDSIELGAGEYKNKITSLFCDVNMLRIILSPEYFLDSDWKTQREYLAVMAGEIKRSDFKGNYPTLYKEMERYTIEELKERIVTISKPLKDQLKSIPFTIDGMMSILPSPDKFEGNSEKVEKKRIEIKDIEDEINGCVNSIQPILDKRNDQLKQIANFQRMLQENQSKYALDFSKKTGELRNKIIEIDSENALIQSKNKAQKSKEEANRRLIESYEGDVATFTQRRLDLLKRKDEVKERVFGNDHCSLCGQLLPEEMLESAKEKFRERNEEDLASIIKEGKANNVKIENAKAEIQRIQKELEEAYNPKPLLDKSELEKQMAELKASYVPYEQTQEFKDLSKSIEKLDSELVSVDTSKKQELEVIKAQKQKELEELLKQQTLEEEYNKTLRKIESLKKEQREAGEELARQEMLSNEIKDYEEEYAKIVSDKVCGYFSRCKITMMSQEKSGKWIPDCVIKGVDGAIYQTCNKAEQILLGIDISNGFSKFNNISFPLFIDDVNLLSDFSQIYTVGQNILLLVSDSPTIKLKYNESQS